MGDARWVVIAYWADGEDTVAGEWSESEAASSWAQRNLDQAKGCEEWAVRPVLVPRELDVDRRGRHWLR